MSGGGVRVQASSAACLVLLAACAGEPASEVAASSTGAAEVSFVDLFADLDEDFWLVSDGWSNGDWTANDWRASQVATGPEGLTITMDRSADGEKPFSGGEIRTIGRYHHGYFEVDMQAPRGSGLVTGFFTYTGSFFGDPHDEIDIEILGKNTREVTFTVFTNDEQKTEVVPLGFDAAEGFHLYGFEWTEDYIRWYVDGRLLHEETPETFPLPTTPQIYYLSLWGSDTLTDWVGPLDADGAPWTLRVRCMGHAAAYTGEPICRPS